MTQAALAPARWAVARQFQRRRANRSPNSYEFEVADHAITLALNPNRRVDAFFARNAWRDAKNVVTRQRRRQQARFVPLYERHEDGSEVEVSAEAKNGLTKYDSILFDAERSIVYADAYAQLRVALERRSRYAPACLDGWRDGEEEHETAVALGISREYVKKLRRMIRQTAAELFAGTEWEL